MPRLGLYVHIPFCPQRCPYCAFAVVTGRRDEASAYVERVCREIALWASLRDRGGVDTVFFGGGTPTFVAPEQLGRILEAADRHLGLAGGAEITCEANPSTAEAARFADLRAIGCTRLSLGVQSFRDRTLRLLGRVHTAAGAERAYRLAREAGFDSVGVDLIFCVPGAPAADWCATLERTVELEPDHVSAYALTVEEGTPFAHRRRRGALREISEEEDEEAFLSAVAVLSGAGYEHYEISNFARPGHRCAHNWDCWTRGEYLGVGVSAHSYLGGRRFWNTSGFDDYRARVDGGGSPRAGEEAPDPVRRRREQLWLGLRTLAGVELDPAEVRHLSGSRLWEQLRRHAHAELDGPRLHLTARGFAVADAVAGAVGDLVLRDAAAA